MKSSGTTNEAIARSARRLRWAVIAAMALMLLLYGAARLGVPLGAARVEYRVHGPDVAAARLVGDLMLVLLMLALFRLTQMLGRIAEGEFFSAGVVGRFRSFAMWLLVAALAGVIAPVLVTLLTQASAHRLEVGLDFQKILMVGVTLVLFLLARLLERARGLDEEVQEFV